MPQLFSKVQNVESSLNVFLIYTDGEQTSLHVGTKRLHGLYYGNPFAVGRVI